MQSHMRSGCFGVKFLKLAGCKSVNNSLQGFHAILKVIEKVLNFKIGFQDFDKVLNLAKMYIRY